MKKILNIKLGFVFIILLTIISCGGNTNTVRNTTKIKMHDSSLIVTEKDTQFLGNVVEDITKDNNVSTKQEVTKIIKKVDSAKEANIIANKESNSVTGTTIEFNNFKVTISVILNQLNNQYKINKFSDLDNAQIQVNGIQNPTIEKRIFTKLTTAIANENYTLNDLQEYANPWQTLTAKENIFQNNTSNLQFRNVNAKQILLATDREMRNAKKGRIDLQNAQKILSNTNSYSDTPCKVIATAIYFKINGLKNGKKVSDVLKIII